MISNLVSTFESELAIFPEGLDFFFVGYVALKLFTLGM